MQCTSFHCVPDNVSPPCQSEDWPPPSGPPPHPPSCKIVGHVDACLQKNTNEILPILRALRQRTRFIQHWRFEPVLWRAKASVNNLKIGGNLCFRLHHKTHMSLPTKLQHGLLTASDRTLLWGTILANAGLSLMNPRCCYGNVTPPLRPCTRWRAAAVFTLSQTLLPAHWARRFPG